MNSIALTICNRLSSIVPLITHLRGTIPVVPETVAVEASAKQSAEVANNLVSQAVYRASAEARKPDKSLVASMAAHAANAVGIAATVRMNRHIAEYALCLTIDQYCEWKRISMIPVRAVKKTTSNRSGSKLVSAVLYVTCTSTATRKRHLHEMAAILKGYTVRQ